MKKFFMYLVTFVLIAQTILPVNVLFANDDGDMDISPAGIGTDAMKDALQVLVDEVYNYYYLGFGFADIGYDQLRAYLESLGTDVDGEPIIEKAMYTAYDVAKNVIEDSAATITDFINALSALAVAFDNFDEAVETLKTELADAKAALQELVDEVYSYYYLGFGFADIGYDPLRAYLESLGTDIDGEPFIEKNLYTAYGAAVAVIANASATVAEIETATANLQEVFDKFDEAVDNFRVELATTQALTALEALLARVNTVFYLGLVDPVDGFIFTNAEYEELLTLNQPLLDAFGDAIVAAKAIDSTSSLTEIITAYDDLLDSFNAFKDGILELRSYEVIFNPNNGIGTMSPQTFIYNVTGVLNTGAFQRTNYNFIGWATTATGTVKYTDKASISNWTGVGKTLTLYAIWTPVGGWGWGWWGGGVSRDYCPNGDNSGSFYDGKCEADDTTQEITLWGEVETTTPTPTSIDEMTLAYQYAYKHGLTTMPTIEAARLQDKITRAELAKVISQYAINVLGKTPNTSKNCLAFLNSIAKYANTDLHGYMITSCQLDIMGIHPNGTALNNFRPDDFVTRAEFWTVFSRLLRGHSYEGTDQVRYQQHLNALKTHEIITNIEPTLQELRGRVFLQIYRAAMKGLISDLNPEPITPEVPVVNPLIDTDWTLQLFDGEAVDGDYTLSFTATNVAAKFCNNIVGEYTLSGDTINATLVQTQMACIDEESMNLEGVFNLNKATFAIASTRMAENNIERLAIVTAEGNSFVWIQAE